MKRFCTSLILLLVAATAVPAQPSWAKKGSKAVFTLKTFSPDGTLLGSSTGFFVGAEGQAVAAYAPFRGAARAVVIDADGKELPVECMLGANDTYDVAKFRVAGVKKAAVLPIAATPAAAGSMVWMLPYREQKKLPSGVVRKAEKFGADHDYYTIALAMSAEMVGAPLLNEQGEVAALVQPAARQADTLCYAVSARYAEGLHISGLSLNEPALRATLIKKDLPQDLEQALLTLYVASSSADSASFVQMVDDFIARFPSAPDGYQYKAQLAYNGNDFAAAQRSFEQAIRVAERKDEPHYAYSRLIYQKELYKPSLPFAEWSLDKSLDEARQAYQLSAQPAYLHQQALVLFAQKQYAQAAALYDQLAATSLRSPELFYEASRCHEMQADTLGQLALLDSAVAMFSRPLLKEAAPFLLSRAQARLGAEKYREAVLDLNDYEGLMKTQLNDNFYYIRHQADLGGRLFQQALDDIDRAIELRPDHDLYYAEKASLLLRVGMYAEAAETARECTKLSPGFSDGYLFLGLALCLQGQREEGLKHLEKARSMGDPQAEDLIQKYAR